VKSKIIFDCERMKYPHTGLFHFCLQLGTGILQENKSKNKICFYTPPSAGKIFGENECYIQQQSFHKFLLPKINDAHIWHSTYQGSSYFPTHKKLKIILTIHDLNFLYDDNKTKAKQLKYLNALNKKIKAADMIVAISHHTLQDVKKHIDVGNKILKVIYNGCNIKEMELEQPDLKTGNDFLFTIGTITNKKNFHVLPRLLHQNNMNLVIAGITQSEEYKKLIIEEAKKWDVADRIIFTGPVSENDKQWYYKNCAAFVFPSVAEGFGLPVVEAMYFGKPVILSTYTSLPEIGGDVCYYFHDFEPANMQQTLAEALEDYKYNHPQTKIIERAQLFSWQKAANEYVKLYDELLS
jgi:glycosyltransferase involved in cell wall biosynthesis